jgi:hypothetical protein
VKPVDFLFLDALLADVPVPCCGGCWDGAAACLGAGLGGSLEAVLVGTSEAPLVACCGAEG